MLMIGRAYVSFGTAKCGACGDSGKHFLDVTLEGDGLYGLHEFLLCRKCAVEMWGGISREMARWDEDKDDVDFIYIATGDER